MPVAITLQFHPDWPCAGRTVIESMADDGFYRSQFVTRISNAGLTAFPGGDRWQWESRLFSARYDGGPAVDRPVYGAWNRRADPYGGAIRFGSSYVRLRLEAVDRATFCFPDSYRGRGPGGISGHGGGTISGQRAGTQQCAGTTGFETTCCRDHRCSVLGAAQSRG